MVERKLFSPIHILTLVANGISILIGIFITILYIKCKPLHNYVCYNKLTINLILLLNNLIRIIPLYLSGDNFSKYIQGFLLIFLDKLFLIILTIQIIIQYIGIMHTIFYYSHQKIIFLIGYLISIIISLILASIFITDGVSRKDDKLYYYGNNKGDFKKIMDTIYDGILLFINVVLIIIILINSFISKQRATSEDQFNNYEYNFIQSLIKFFVNAITYVISFLINFSQISGFSDFAYLLNFIIVDIFYCFNKIILREMRYLFCKNKYKDEIDENTYKKTNTFNEYSIDSSFEDEDDD